MTSSATNDAIGLWLLGARGGIATCVTYGLSGLREGLIEPIGLFTATDPFDALDLAPLEKLVIGGHDVCRRTLSQSAAELAQNAVLTPDLVAASAGFAAAVDARLRPGVLDGPDVGLADLDPRAAELGSAAPRAQIARLQEDLADFVRENELARVVVVNLASTEASRDPLEEWRSLAAFEAALDAERAQPASLLYAYAALDAGHPFVNFTPNLGASIPALRELARERRVPHCGNDGKTGETLVKTVLGPMFRARALRVLAWQGYNMLGNRDGEVLSDSAHRESKLRNKNEALRSILSDERVHSKVGIDYVPSLQDWKTAWDFIHFEGFLGARMSLQFTWSGSDSALAAPLILDLVRLTEYSARQGEFGELAHTASFFKAPLAGGEHDFFKQHEALVRYAEQHAKASGSEISARTRRKASEG